MSRNLPGLNSSSCNKMRQIVIFVFILVFRMPGSGDKIGCTFTIYNVLVMVLGGLVVGMASWFMADKKSFLTTLQLLEVEEGHLKEEHFQNIFSAIDYGVFVLVAIGVIIMIQSMLGCTGIIMGFRENRNARSCLITYGVLVTMAIVLEIVVAVLVLHVYKENVTEKARNMLVDTIKTDYKLPSQGRQTRFHSHQFISINKVTYRARAVLLLWWTEA